MTVKTAITEKYTLLIKYDLRFYRRVHEKIVGSSLFDIVHKVGKTRVQIIKQTMAVVAYLQIALYSYKTTGCLVRQQKLENVKQKGLKCLN